LSGNISGTDPLKDNRLHLKAEPLDDSEEAKNTAAVVNELSKIITHVLVSHPINAKRAAEGKNIANVVLLRGCGIRIEVRAKDLIFPHLEIIHICNSGVAT
jgi:2,3-bisphosphoglycerate-independent phosphoglycerate mutase